MGVVLSLIVIGIGAILRWAVTTDPSGVNLATVGIILIIVGLLGLIASIVSWWAWDARWGWGGDRWRRGPDPPP
jgi:hypothetical protein